MIFVLWFVQFVVPSIRVEIMFVYGLLILGGLVQLFCGRRGSSAFRIFALTDEPFIVFSSNIFAILGLRSLYFLLKGAVDKFHLLKYGLGVVLVFVGLKMVWLNRAFGGHFPILPSLAIIVGVIAASIILSLLFPKAPEEGR